MLRRLHVTNNLTGELVVQLLKGIGPVAWPNAHRCIQMTHPRCTPHACCRHIMVDLGFKYPQTLSGFGMVCSGLLSFLACRVFRFVECKATISWRFWATKMLPVGLFMVRWPWLI
jgi:hypothetical protein